MSEPRRLLQEGGSERELSLLRSARDDAPSPHARRKTMVALGLAGGVGATVTATATSTAATALLKTTATAALIKWIAVGVVGGLITVGAASVVQSRRGSDPDRALVASKGNAQEARRQAQAVAAAETPPPAATADEAPVPAPTATAAAAIDPPRASARPAEKPTLTEEVAALDVAREALAAGNAAGALRALDDHDRRFAGGALGPEAMVLRIQALVLRGDRATATRLGNAYLEAHPRSPHASRVRSLIGAAEPAP